MKFYLWSDIIQVKTFTKLKEFLMTTTITSQDLQQNSRLSLGKGWPHFFHQDGLIWSVNTRTIMVGMSSQQPLHLVPTELQESVRIRSCVSSQETLKTKGSLKFHLKISTWKEHNWTNYPKACSTSCKKLVMSLIAEWMSMSTVIFQMDRSFFFSFAWALDWRHSWETIWSSLRSSRSGQDRETNRKSLHRS